MEIDSFCPVGIGGTHQLDTTNLKIFIGNLPFEYRSKDLFFLFGTYGPIREAIVIPDSFRIRSRCYGFVTFVNEESIEKLSNNIPLYIKNRRLTIKLACKNAKPRRAQFNVRHGTTGYKTLPSLNKHCYVVNINNGNRNTNTYNENMERHANSSVERKPPVIYNDPSLFRTANIQDITPACIQTDDNCSKKIANKEIIKQYFPNKDIEKHYERPLQIKAEGKRSNNIYLNCVQVKKVNREINNQSKNISPTETNNTTSNQKTTCTPTISNFNTSTNGNNEIKKAMFNVVNLNSHEKTKLFQISSNQQNNESNV